MSREDDLKAVELSLEEAQLQVKKHEALARLEKNKDFQFLFIEQLLKEDAISQIHLRASPRLVGDNEGSKVARAGIEQRMTMIGELANWCRYVHMEGQSAKAAIAEHENTREEILEEQLEE